MNLNHGLLIDQCKRAFNHARQTYIVESFASVHYLLNQLMDFDQACIDDNCHGQSHKHFEMSNFGFGMLSDFGQTLYIVSL